MPSSSSKSVPLESAELDLSENSTLRVNLTNSRISEHARLFYLIRNLSGKKANNFISFEKATTDSIFYDDEIAGQVFQVLGQHKLSDSKYFPQSSLQSRKIRNQSTDLL